MRMIYDEKLAQAAYLIGCQRAGEAVVIDPERDVDRYIDLAKHNGLRIVATAETHIHADFVSGSRELAERVGAKVYVSDEGDADWKYEWLDKKVGGSSYDHQLLKDGDSFKIGNIELKAIHTPGHTPEHIVFLVTDHGANATEPIGMATGDFVFVGDLGRPDLLETAAGHAGAMEPSARRLFSTVKKLGEIPDFVQVWPAHGAGSACGKALGAVPMSTFGYEKRFNPAIQAAASEQGFVDFILTDQPEPPMYFANMKRDNKIGPPVLGGLPQPKKMSAADLAKLDTSVVAIVDTRAWEDFRSGHIAGSLSFPLTKSFNTDAGSMVKDSDDIYLVIDEGDLDEAIRDLIRV
ncbi:MAG: MBL fold metallo-hydrolase, partial [Pseudomonadota bacterium]|nr:MBL fold metallo-hydrolase [Pseudomonadota bacterium]